MNNWRKCIEAKTECFWYGKLSAGQFLLFYSTYCHVIQCFMDLNRHLCKHLTHLQTHKYTQAHSSAVSSHACFLVSAMFQFLYTHTHARLRNQGNSLSSWGAIQWMPSKNIWSPKGIVHSKEDCWCFPQESDFKQNPAWHTVNMHLV